MAGGLLLSGDLRIGLFDTSGNFAGYFDQVFNATQLALNPGDVTEQTRPSRKRDTFGQALSVVKIPSAWTMDLTIDDITDDSLRLAMLGELEAINVTSGSITDESVTAQHDKWVPLDNVDLTDGTVVVDSDPSGTTFTDGTDYEVDLRNGLLKALSTGTITDGQALLVDYDHGAVSGTRIQAARKQSLKARLRLDGHDLDDGTRHNMIAWSVPLTPNGGIDLMSGEFLALALNGTMETPAGKTAPFLLENLGPDS